MPAADHSNAERFEAAFNRIQQRLLKIAKGARSDSFVDLLYHARSHNSVINTYLEELKQYAKLRNAMVHGKTQLAFYIAEPHSEVVEQIEHICRLLENPPTALSIAAQPVVHFDLRDPLRAVLTAISETGNSQFPIYNHGLFAGLLTEGGIARWLASQTVAQLDGVYVADVLPFEENRTVEFIPRTANVFDVEDRFEAAVRARQKLEALIVTANGSNNALPIGIITSWDLVKITEAVHADYREPEAVES